MVIKVFSWRRKCAILLAGFALLCIGDAYGKIVRAGSFSSHDAALATCTAGDVYLIDKSLGGTINNPPSGIQIVGGNATWNLSKDVTDIVLFNHTPTIKQSSGRLARVTSNGSLGRGSKLTHVDSCFFIMGSMGVDGLNYEIDGFLRHSTFAFNGSYMGSSRINLPGTSSWIRHISNFLINATDPIGDGSGTLICNVVSHGQIDWTPVHIINGRGITVAHVNSEYCEFSDPFVSIENGVECAAVHQNPGGTVSSPDWESYQALDDGTRAYSWMGSRWGHMRVAGMNNSVMGGVSYTPFRAALTGAAWSSLVARDPYLTKWNVSHGGGINFAKPLRTMGFGTADASMMKTADHGFHSAVISDEVACTTAFIDSNRTFLPGRLRGRPLRPGPSLYRPYVPEMPRIKLDGDGPGTNMSTSTGKEILDVVNSGATVYLEAGTYQIPGTLSKGTVYGAGKDLTILKFPADSVCSIDKIGFYNLTVEGGTVGYLQATYPPSCHSLSHSNIRFKGQSSIGAQLSCVQNCTGFYFIEFDSCGKGITTAGNCKSIGMNDNKAIDKFNLYGCTFRNLERGVRLAGGTDGFISMVGCRFENVSEVGAMLESRGNYVAGCDFINCAQSAIYAKYMSTIHNCNITGPATSKGITGNFQEVISCAIDGCATAIEVGTENAVIADCKSNGNINSTPTTWIGISTFKNVEVPRGARYGSIDLTEWVHPDGIPIDQTEPSTPKDLKVAASGAHNVLAWEHSLDPESGIMQYIIERDNQEIGRTNFNYHANYHVLREWWGPEGWPGAGVYRNPRPVYVDSNAAATYSQANYRVVAVNFAQIRSDSSMAQIRLWSHSISPYRLTGPDFTRRSDSVYVGLGTLSLPSLKSKSYTAVRYRGKSGSGITRGLTELVVSSKWPPKSGLKFKPGTTAGPTEIFSLNGALIMRLNVDRTLTNVELQAAIERQCRTKGVYMVRHGGIFWRSIHVR